MALARGTQAQNEPQRAWRKIRLVWMRHDGRIEQRRGFERVFMRKIRAEQQLALTMQNAVCSQSTAAICNGIIAEEDEGTLASHSEMVVVSSVAAPVGPIGLG